ncbi:T-cell surface antigen CD2-like isoform X1 [Hypomesus transpacificus]|uniref:T-cell surface antigen CD2-like isoform X1 n=1 Tax=Hypomesus transpacificus TaxID=137520 RepID=UPI001F07185B|nr:T-cell surface antigen CD2-like isoform X1 [Hypomesus transpacificus]
MSSGRPGSCRGVSGVSGWTLLFLTLTYTATEDFRHVISRSGEAVMLDVNMSEVDDPRWKHAGMLLASHNKTKYEHFQLLPNGSLLLRSGRSTDSGNYTVDVYDKRGRKTLTMTYRLLILDVPEVHARCALDGSLVLTCSVQSEENVPMRWVGPDVPANQSMTLGLELTLYLPSMKENITCEVDNKLRIAHSQPPLLECRDRVPTVVVVVVFSLSVLTLSLLQLRTTCNRTQLTAGEDSVYVEMHGDRKPTQTTRDRSAVESSYTLMQSNIGVPPQGDAANTDVYESCGSGTASPEGPAKTQQTSTAEQENIYC